MQSQPRVTSLRVSIILFLFLTPAFFSTCHVDAANSSPPPLSSSIVDHPFRSLETFSEWDVSNETWPTSWAHVLQGGGPSDYGFLDFGAGIFEFCSVIAPGETETNVWECSTSRYYTGTIKAVKYASSLAFGYVSAPIRVLQLDLRVFFNDSTFVVSNQSSGGTINLPVGKYLAKIQVYVKAQNNCSVINSVRWQFSSLRFEGNAPYVDPTELAGAASIQYDFFRRTWSCPVPAPALRLFLDVYFEEEMLLYVEVFIYCVASGTYYPNRNVTKNWAREQGYFIDFDAPVASDYEILIRVVGTCGYAYQTSIYHVLGYVPNGYPKSTQLHLWGTDGFGISSDLVKTYVGYDEKIEVESFLHGHKEWTPISTNRSIDFTYYSWFLFQYASPEGNGLMVPLDNPVKIDGISGTYLWANKLEVRLRVFSEWTRAVYLVINPRQQQDRPWDMEYRLNCSAWNLSAWTTVKIDFNNFVDLQQVHEGIPTTAMCSFGLYAQGGVGIAGVSLLQEDPRFYLSDGTGPLKDREVTGTHDGFLTGTETFQGDALGSYLVLRDWQREYDFFYGAGAGYPGGIDYHKEMSVIEDANMGKVLSLALESTITAPDNRLAATWYPGTPVQFGSFSCWVKVMAYDPRVMYRVKLGVETLTIANYTFEDALDYTPDANWHYCLLNARGWFWDGTLVKPAATNPAPTFESSTFQLELVIPGTTPNPGALHATQIAGNAFTFHDSNVDPYAFDKANLASTRMDIFPEARYDDLPFSFQWRSNDHCWGLLADLEVPQAAWETELAQTALHTNLTRLWVDVLPPATGGELYIEVFANWTLRNSSHLLFRGVIAEFRGNFPATQTPAWQTIAISLDRFGVAQWQAQDFFAGYEWGYGEMGQYFIDRIRIFGGGLTPLVPTTWKFTNMYLENAFSYRLQDEAHRQDLDSMQFAAPYQTVLVTDFYGQPIYRGANHWASFLDLQVDLFQTKLENLRSDTIRVTLEKCLVNITYTLAPGENRWIWTSGGFYTIYITKSDLRVVEIREISLFTDRRVTINITEDTDATSTDWVAGIIDWLARLGQSIDGNTVLMFLLFGATFVLKASKRARKQKGEANGSTNTP